ncbi:MAG: M3 family oligoendopeptidase [Deltaproteobacteria bacterium]|nr:M3 family oligoendopeptidase [Deltaproteobacteria bacterium]MBW2360113.1 M3 family oligoendopeptidase [Deltaproteobacteria bacterium]
MSAEAEVSDPGPATGVTWDLADLYAGTDDPQIDVDLDAALAEAERFAAAHRGGIAEISAAALAEAVDALEAIHTHATRAAVFSHLLFAADTSEQRHGALLQRVQERSTEIRNKLLFFELEWVALGEPRAEALLEDPALATRRHFLGALRRYRPHVLSEPEERILEEKANTGTRAFGRLFDEMVSAMRFRLRRGDEETELGEEETLALLYHPDREERRAASEALTEGLKANARPLTFIFNTLLQDKSVDDRLRAYPSPIAARNLANEIDGPGVESLLSACVARYPLVARYYRLKTRLLGLDQLEDYDRYAPMSVDGQLRPFDEARSIVLGAYGDFSSELADVAGQFFERRWIDAELRPGKRGGAFCASTIPDAHPYVLLNYTGNLRDVMTVAHELGHGVHQYLARERGLFEQDTPLTTAETASVFGEMLVFRRLLREESDPKVRLALLCGKLEDAFATVFRQVAMTRFEETLHEARRTEGELPLERINALWMDANRPMFEDSVHLRDDYAWWWLYIPHFVHSPFYCYAYAFGELLVLALLRRYDEEGDAFVPRYLELLRAGGSHPPEVLLARVGLDITDPGFWDGGLALLEGMVAEAEKLADATP